MLRAVFSAYATYIFLPSKFMSLNQMCRVKTGHARIPKHSVGQRSGLPSLCNFSYRSFFSHSCFLRLFFSLPPIHTKPEWNLEPKRRIFLNGTFPYLIFCISKPAASKSDRVHVWPWARIAACKVLKGNIKKCLNDFLQRTFFYCQENKKSQQKPFNCQYHSVNACIFVPEDKTVVKGAILNS